MRPFARVTAEGVLTHGAPRRNFKPGNIETSATCALAKRVTLPLRAPNARRFVLKALKIEGESDDEKAKSLGDPMVRAGWVSGRNDSGLPKCAAPLIVSARCTPTS